MALETITVRAELNGDGSEGPFQCGFRVLNASDVKVYVDGSATPKSLNTHYTVANAGTTSNATVTFTSGNFPQAGTKNVVLVREVPYTQPSNYQNNTALDAETLEASFDRATMQAQQSTEKIDRSLKFSDTATEIDATVTEIAAPADSRKNKYIGFDDSGNMSLADAISNPLITSTNPQAGDMLRYNGSKYVNTPIKDENGMDSNSQSHVPSQASVKAYVDAQDTAIASDTLEFTNKTFDADGTGNSLTNVDVGNLKSGVLDANLSDGTSSSDDTIPSAKAVKTYVDNSALSIIDEDNMATDTASRPPSQQSVKAYADQLAFQGKPHIIPGILYPAVGGNDIHGNDIDTSHGSAYTYGELHTDGRKYYYTDIKGSKPIKDPRIGAHFGSQRHKWKSFQLLPQETVASGANIYSVDGREWARVYDKDLKLVEYNGSHYQGAYMTQTTTGDQFIEVVAYANDLNVLWFTSTTRNFNVSVNGGTVQLNTGGTTNVNSPIGDRYVDATSVVKASFNSTPSLGINTFKISNIASNWFYVLGIELIAHDTSNVNEIKIPKQNVVSYGKKFEVGSDTMGDAVHPHYDPFNGFTSGNLSAVQALGIDTDTSLGLSKWLPSDAATTYYRPFNGGRIIKWVDSSGTIKTSVNMMPPNARSIANSASPTNAFATRANASDFGTNNAMNSFETGTDLDVDRLSEVAKTFHWREFGNGSANGGTEATYADASMLENDDDIAYIMDDGLTSFSGKDVDKHSTYDSWDLVSSGENANYIFIGTGFSIKNENHATLTYSYDIYVDGVLIGNDVTLNGYKWANLCQNLPYGTHIIRFEHAGSSGAEVATFSEVSFHQPKRPPIPEDACVLADYMLMADHQVQADCEPSQISKGVRYISGTRDHVCNAQTDAFSETTSIKSAEPAQFGMVGFSTHASQTGSALLPFFGTNAQAVVYGSNTAGYSLELGGVGKTEQILDSSANIHDDMITIADSEKVTLGITSIKTNLPAGGYRFVGSMVATPIHTSFHYQPFETPFLYELVGGDRNMEQNNLVCSPDGKSWDELTRDTSYIGNALVSARITSDQGQSWAYDVWDDFRGERSAGDHLYNKDFAIAYDRWICLKEGFYNIYMHNETAATAVGGGIIFYVNTSVIQKTEGYPGGSGWKTPLEINVNAYLKRGDYLRAQVYNVEGDDLDRNIFHITRL